MARKLIDTYPQITLTIGGEVPKYTSYKMGPEEAQDAADEINELIRTVLQRATKRQMDVETKIVSEHVCEHCRSPWTEAGADYNGGCCGLDEASSPGRLGALQSLVDEVEAGDFWAWDADHGRSRVKIDWPWALACAADAWLKAERPIDGIGKIISLAQRVKSTSWCTVWEDPGPSGCSLARLADRVTQDIRPEQLADELLSLLDDMGLLPATKAVAHG